MNYFGEKLIFFGALYNDVERLENVRCELSLDQLNPNNNNLFVFYSSQDIQKIDKIILRNKIFINSELPNRIINVKASLKENKLFSESEWFLALNVNEVLIDHKYVNDLPIKYSFSFHLTKSIIFRRKNVITTHSTKGLLSGWNGWRKDRSSANESEWKDEKNIISFSPYEAYIIPGFEFQSIKEKDSYKVYNQLYFAVFFNGSLDKNVNDLQNDISYFVDSYLKIISFAEGNYIRWHYLTINLDGKSPLPILERKIFRRTRPVKEKLQDDLYYIKNTEKYKKIIPMLFTRYNELEEDKKHILDRVLDRFMVSTTHDKIDTKIIYWHSCLDLMINIFNRQKGKNFNEQLIILCEKLGVNWKDLFPYIDTNNLTREKGFLINKIRTNIIHRGEYPEDYTTIYFEMFKVRALCERLIFKYLNLNYENTPFGYPHITES